MHVYVFDIIFSLFVLFSLCIFNHIFFFKQKTAYELRISDWSSDVCSSDLSSTWVTSAVLLSPDCSMYEVDWTANVLVSWLTVAELLSPVCSMSDTFCGVAPEPSSACVTFALLLAPLWLTRESPPESEPVWSTTAPLAGFGIGRAPGGERGWTVCLIY